jgi:hypothetical protein
MEIQDDVGSRCETSLNLFVELGAEEEQSKDGSGRKRRVESEKGERRRRMYRKPASSAPPMEGWM